MSEGATIKLPEKLIPIFAPPRGAVQYRGAKGGRGSGKSVGFATMAATWGYVEPLRILCVRDLQVSIKESFHAELKGAIAQYPWLEEHYDVGVDYLRARDGGTEFLFRGLRHGTTTIKSLSRIDLTIIEEAEDATEVSWLALEATVFRQPKSEIWAIWNPRKAGSPVDQRLVTHKPKNALIATMNWQDNPFFPKNMEILRQREQERLDDATYQHVWEGAYLVNSKAQVLAGKYVSREFTPGKDWHGPYQGGDFGFSQDPLAAVRCWIYDGCLYVEYEAGKVELELDDTGKFICDRIPDFDKYVARWDNARPESISHIKRQRAHFMDKRVPLPKSIACKKWKGSVEDGIEFLKAFKQIIVHPRCPQTLNECRLYSYKVDKLTGDILPDLVDAYNHFIDAIRYALGPLIQRTGYSLDDLKEAMG